MGERPNERVTIVGIGWALLASATSRFSGCIKLAYCSSAKGLQYLTSIQKVLGSIPSWVPFLGGDFYTLSESLSSLEEFVNVQRDVFGDLQYPLTLVTTIPTNFGHDSHILPKGGSPLSLNLP